MAWYYGTYSCGHEGRVDIVGKSKDREWKVNAEFSKLCRECYLEKLKNDREEQSKVATEKNKERELPELLGSEKQIAWAESLRDKVVTEGDELLDKIRKQSETLPDDFGDVLEAFDYVKKQTQAKYWIDNRGKQTNRLLLESLDILKKGEKDKPD